jgi:hypothetical protein
VSIKAWQEEALMFAEQGSKVAVFADTLEVSQGFLPDFESLLDGQGVRKIRRVHGSKAIDFYSGGEIRFYSTRSIPRGKSLDRLYVPAGVGHESMEALAPLVMTSTEPAIVGYFD